MSTPEVKPRLMRKPAFAVWACVSLRMVDKLIASGALPVVHIGKSARIDIVDAEKFIEARKSK